MSLRPSGFWCDVCGEVMATEMLLNTPVKSFTLSCAKGEFHAHDKCVPVLSQAAAALDETLLPERSPIGRLIVKVKEHNRKIAESP